MVILETKLSMSLWCKGVSVKVFYKSNNLINEFTAIINIAKYFGIFIRTIGRYLDKDKSYNGFVFISKFKDNYYIYNKTDCSQIRLRRIVWVNDLSRSNRDNLKNI